MSELMKMTLMPQTQQGPIFRVTLSDRLDQRAWNDRRVMSWDQLIMLLSAHEEGEKDGSCLTPAIFRGSSRRKANAEEIGLLILDVDCGHSLEEVEQAISTKDLAAVIYSTHSHLKAETNVSKAAFEQAGLSPECYLVHRVGLLPRVAAGASIVSQDEQSVLIRHVPCPKYRVVLPLHSPWRASDYPDQETGNNVWHERVLATAAYLGIKVDESCCDTSRLFFLPRHPPGAPSATKIITGNPLSIWDLPPMMGSLPETGKGRHLSASPSRENSLIDQFNRKFPIEHWLEKYGYKRRGSKWLSPHSTTGMPGISLRNGRAFCHHQSDPLFSPEGHAHDAFGIHTILGCQGDIRKAVKEAARMLNLDHKNGYYSNIYKGAEESASNHPSDSHFTDSTKENHDDKRRHCRQDDDISTTERRQTSELAENIDEIVELIQQLGLSEPDQSHLIDIVNGRSIKEPDPEYLVHLCRQTVVEMSSSCRQCRQLSSRQPNLTAEVRTWVMAAPGLFRINDIYQDLNIIDRDQRKAVSKVLERLSAEGIIVHDGKRRGQFRIVDDSCEIIDWMNASGETVPVLWPFGLEKYVEIMPGNVVVVAGEPNAGKTAFLLNVVEKNMHAFDIHYFSSEMGASEFRKRVLGFQPTRMPNDWRFTAYERSSNFADKIKPGKGVINIIDFLEIHEDFWRVGALLPFTGPDGLAEKGSLWQSVEGGIHEV